MKKTALVLLSAIVIGTSCSSTKKAVTIPVLPPEINSLKFLGKYIIPNKLQFQNTTVGGLSSIDFDAKNNLYYMICDDRSDINPARFYTAKISTSLNGIDSFNFISVTSLLQANGTPYPNNSQDAAHTPDPEAMRYDPFTKLLVWSSEGERIVRPQDTVLADPFIAVISPNGRQVSTYSIPPLLKMSSSEHGPRRNGVFEGLCFADNYKTLFVNVEEPLYEDGPRVDVTDNSTYIRILQFDTATKTNIAQYAYKPEPVAYQSIPATGYKINGVPDILSVGHNKLLVTERSFSSGRIACTIKIFIADLSAATDIKDNFLLQANKNLTPAAKKMVANFDDLKIYIDNIEGATFGPVLPNGHASLLFIADNNFNALEQSQVLLFEID